LPAYRRGRLGHPALLLGLGHLALLLLRLDHPALLLLLLGLDRPALRGLLNLPALLLLLLLRWHHLGQGLAGQGQNPEPDHAEHGSPTHLCLEFAHG
jgi:hypothetical protein